MSKQAGFQPAAICNIVLLGHTGTGKTTLIEAILHRCGAIKRAGTVGDASTVSDFEPERARTTTRRARACCSRPARGATST